LIEKQALAAGRHKLDDAIGLRTSKKWYFHCLASRWVKDICVQRRKKFAQVANAKAAPSIKEPAIASVYTQPRGVKKSNHRWRLKFGMTHPDQATSLEK
jgi:hypothetical protein